MTTDVKNCARCGKNHENIPLMRLNNHSKYTHFAICPNTYQPILVTVTHKE